MNSSYSVQWLEKCSHLVGHEFEFVKWDFADVELSMFPLLPHAMLKARACSALTVSYRSRDALVLNRLPQSLNKHIVAPASLGIHVDGDAAILEQLREFETGELAGVEDFEPAAAVNRLLHRLYAEIGRQRIRQAP